MGGGGGGASVLSQIFMNAQFAYSVSVSSALAFNIYFPQTCCNTSMGDALLLAPRSSLRAARMAPEVPLPVPGLLPPPPEQKEPLRIRRFKSKSQLLSQLFIYLI